MNKEKTISNAEHEVMKVLWKAGTPLSFTQIRLKLQDEKKWDKSTINTLIRRLITKEIIIATKKEILYYTARVSERDYHNHYARDVVDRIFEGSAKNFMAAFYDGGKLTKEEIEELRSFINNYEVS